MRVSTSFVFNWLFYTAKPAIPRQVQIFLRRKLAAYKREKCSHVWPIDPNSAQPPEGWQGWPEGKQFALVLSHDVDTIHGFNNVSKVAELEERMGFRSCFNFVPERYGKVPLDFLDQLRKRGFDVAVHGLKHDGKLFLSRRTFERQALRINAYFKEWQTEGFTSPSMHRNLEWMSGLNMEYSTSTFDTDPFEPQPDGVGTIFPFWAASSSPKRSFLEIAYTVPQDSTLFIILREKTIDIWKRKLDWIAEKGGMALLNTHPDYMNFNDGRCRMEEYPIRFYEAFLQYVKSQYEGGYWHALPREVARFWKEKMVIRENRNLEIRNSKQI